MADMPWPTALWAVLARLCLSVLGMQRGLRCLEYVPSPRVLPPATRCLERSLARSQQLRRQGISHRFCIGVRGPSDAPQGHAWIEPDERAPEGYVVVLEVER